MFLKEYRRFFIDQLTAIYDDREAEQLFYMLLNSINKMSRVDVALAPQTILNPDDLISFSAYLKRLLTHEPIQYLLGETSFYGLDFSVNPNVLIPRPETEELVELIINENQHKTSLRILDIGTGSGCIAISLAKNLPQATVFALDVSENALEIARKNAEKNKVSVSFIHQDILKSVALVSDFDVIVSNPPYVRNLEKAEIKNNVLDYEPHLALFVSDDNPLVFYDKITALAKEHLTEKGMLYFEINQYLPHEMEELLAKYDFKSIVLHKDIYSNYRIISGSRS